MPEIHRTPPGADSVRPAPAEGIRQMADLYLKALESERRSLWAECRLKGLAKDTAERLRIAELDRLLAEHKAKKAD